MVAATDGLDFKIREMDLGSILTCEEEGYIKRGRWTMDRESSKLQYPVHKYLVDIKRSYFTPNRC